MTIMNEAGNVFFSEDIATLHATEKKIQSFKELERGWHYGEGMPLDHSTLDRAASLNREAIRLAFFETDAFPGFNGEVMLTIYSNNHYLEFTLELDGSITFCHEKDGEEICYQEGLSFQDAKAKIGELRGKEWKGFGFSTNDITIVDCADLPVSHSRTQVATRESRLSAENVYSSSEELFVSTSESTTQELRLIPLFFGVSQQRHCQLITG